MAKPAFGIIFAACIALGRVAAQGEEAPAENGPSNIPPEDSKQPDDVCFASLGCFSMSSPWWSFLRPVPKPDVPENIGTAFYLFTRQQPRRTRVTIDPEINLRNVDYNGGRQTIFITHGLSSDSNATWMIDMKDALLEKFDANVFLTDWGPGASGILKYKNAVSNTRVVSAEMSRLIQHLMTNYGVDPKSIHLIGHSLGAHISAYTGKRIKTIGRLTALDPAQPAFEGYDKRVRLDSSDAAFVEVIHTDAKPTIPTFGLGMMGAFGHVDYYINGGYMQPGCLIPKELPPIRTITDFLQLPVVVINNIVSCPHGRAALVFTEAVRFLNCTFWGHPGNVVENVVGAISRGYLHRYLTPSDEDCNANNCSPMKLENINYPARGSFVVPTTSDSPYCIHEPVVDGRMAKEVTGILRGVSRGTIEGLGGLSQNLPRTRWTPGR